MGALYSRYLFPTQGPATYFITNDGESLGYRTLDDLNKWRQIPLIWLHTSKSKIPAAYFQAPGGAFQKQTIIFSHGNAEDMGFSMLYGHRLSKALDVNVLCYEYTGYGLSEPLAEDDQPLKASEPSMYKDILAAYDYLVGRGCLPRDIILFGRSLGSAPSCKLASIRPVGGLVLISALASALRVAIPWLKVDLKGIDMFRNLHLMKSGKILCPTLVVHGVKDDIVPISHAKSILEACPTPAFCPFYHQDGGHEDVELVDWESVVLYYSEFLYALRVPGMLVPSPRRRRLKMPFRTHNTVRA